MITTIGAWTLNKLQISVVFGVAAAVVFIIVPTVIIFIESQHAKVMDHGSGFGHLLTALGRAGILVVGWLLFISIVFFLIIGVANTGSDATPAYGIWSFWNVDWMNPSVLNSLDSSSKIYTDHGEQGLALARLLAFGMTIMKYAAIFSAGSIFLLLGKFALSSHVAPRHHERTEYSFGDIITFLLLFMATIIIFSMIVSLMNESIKSVLAFSGRMGIAVPSNDIDIFDDFWLVLQNGLAQLAST